MLYVVPGVQETIPKFGVGLALCRTAPYSPPVSVSAISVPPPTGCIVKAIWTPKLWATPASPSEVVEKIRALADRQKRLERELESLKAKAASGATSDLAGQALDVNGVRVLAVRLEGFDAKALRDAMDRLKQQLVDAVIVLAGTDGGKATLVAGVSGAAAGKVKAGDLLGDVARQVNGKGGGRPDMAQGGGDDGPALIAALAKVPAWVGERLGMH